MTTTYTTSAASVAARHVEDAAVHQSGVAIAAAIGVCAFILGILDFHGFPSL
jgi:hypothetical protein